MQTFLVLLTSSLTLLNYLIYAKAEKSEPGTHCMNTSLMKNSDFFKLHAGRCIRGAALQISRLRHFIKFPSGQTARDVKSSFYRIAGFPNVLGCIDGTHIKIKRPKSNESDFVNRKGWHSINVQMCCDAEFRITSCSATWPGSVHDSCIFRASALCTQFENDSSVHIHCIHCFLPQNCIGNNSCIEGTTGDTCEKCIREGYQRIGNSCLKCDQVPLPLIGFGVYLLFFILMSFCSGFTSSLCTKFKIICHYLQMLYLTSHLKVQWPALVRQASAIASLSKFNSDVFSLECLFPGLPYIYIVYLQWTSSFGILIAVLVTTLLLDRSMKLMLKLEDDNVKRRAILDRKATVRRLMFFVFVVMYMPVTLSAFHTFLCSDTVPVEYVFDHSKSVFLYDQSSSCSGLFFQLLNLLATIMLLLYVVLMPLILAFFTLRQRKWELLAKAEITYGSVYESYRDDCCFWESIIMVRKVLAVAITDLYPLNMIVQCSALLGMTGAYLLLSIVLRPYRFVMMGSRNLQIHLAFDVMSNLVVAFAQGLGLMVVLDMTLTTLDYLMVGAAGTVAFLGLVMLMMSPMENKQEQSTLATEQISVDMKASTSGNGILRKNNKVSPAPRTFAEEVKERKKNVDF